MSANQEQPVSSPEDKEPNVPKGEIKLKPIWKPGKGTEVSKVKEYMCRQELGRTGEDGVWRVSCSDRLYSFDRELN